MPLENAKTDSLNSILLPRMMTPLERAAGRFMRAPDHGEGGEGGGEASGEGTGGSESQGAEQQDGAQGGEAEGGEGNADSLMSGVGEPGAKEGEGAEAGKEGEAGEKREAAEESAVPEAYELTAPEGFEITPELTAEATPVFKELGLSNDQANTLMPLAAKFAERIQATQNDAFQAMAADWAKESQAAPDIGGTHWTETENNVARAYAVAASKLPPIPVMKDGKPLVENGKPVMISGKEQVQSFRDLLGNSKLGNHPTMIRMFNLFGAQVGEDNDFVRPDAGAQVKLSREQVLYPNDAPKTD